MILLKNITLKNFLSIGQVTQAVNFDRQDLTLILGENLDMGGDGARNGTGKTSLIQGLSYVLFGVPINSIRKDNLVNRTNGKGMLVTLEFSINGIDYKIERGRKPNVLRFYVDNNLQKAVDDAQGDSRETQQAIERALNMSSDMFKHIVALNTYSEPFLAMKTNDQRNIIEQLLGITILSEKAETIKSLIKDSKDAIQTEEFRVKAVEEANKRVIEQIDSLKRRQKLWTTKHGDDLNKFVVAYDELSKIDILTELQSHKDLVIYNQNQKINEAYDSLIARQTSWAQKRDREVSDLQKLHTKLNAIDIAVELESHIQVAQYNQRVKDKAAFDVAVTRFRTDIARDEKIVVKLEKELISLRAHTCYACGQEFHDDKHTQVLTDKEHSLDEAVTAVTATQVLLDEKIANPIELGKMPSTRYKTETEAIKHSGEVERLQQQITAKSNETNPYCEQISEIKDSVVNLGRAPSTIYDTEAEAVTHSSTVDNLLTQIETKSNETDPYDEQITEMEHQAIQETSFDKINQLTRTMEHQKFLMDLLVSKDSFVRKRIIDQNLSYLNTRLTHYLDAIGLPHQVVFQNDLNVEITELGRELDFDNLSRGERNRLILGLSFAFRDVWENLYTPINTLFIDELIDSGLDTVGVENSIAILKDMSRRRNKSIWLVSHREELAGRVPSVLKVIKENGFTSYSTSVEME